MQRTAVYVYLLSLCYLIIQNSATYWEGKADAESLQRIYGVSFPDTKQLKEWKYIQEEAAKRDHRKIGRVRNTISAVYIYFLFIVLIRETLFLQFMFTSGLVF